MCRSAPLARLDDGQLRARSLLAGGGAARDARSPSAGRPDRGRVRDLPHADGTRRGASGRPAGTGLRAPAGADATSRTPDRLAADGVSCTLCHQIGRERLGTPRELHWRLRRRARRRATGAAHLRSVPSRRGPRRVMHSAAGFAPTEATHMRQSELCATCHTLYTKALGPHGEVIGRRCPSRCPYLEWRHSAFIAPNGAASPATCPRSPNDAGLVGAGPAARRASRAMSSSAGTSSCCAC